jgi:hypothetical protein|tara:strand:+ start:104 stop:580 length:477 start_codon:yes stop_codon:yes gene_type:complete
MALKKTGRRKAIKAFEQGYRNEGKIKTGEYASEKREFYYDRKSKKVELLPSDDADRPITDGVKKRNLGSNFKSPLNNEPRKTTKGKGRNFRTTEEGAGMTKKGVDTYKKKNPGSKLKTAVTGDVKPGSKAAKRRKSFCARSKGWTGERGKAARARWKC